MIVMTVFGEYLCTRTEMKAIPRQSATTFVWKKEKREGKFSTKVAFGYLNLIGKSFKYCNHFTFVRNENFDSWWSIEKGKKKQHFNWFGDCETNDLIKLSQYRATFACILLFFTASKYVSSY
jgi:hypothetical protein